jgi:hypothetical protein
LAKSPLNSPDLIESLDADMLQTSIWHARRSLCGIWYAGIINTASPFQGIQAADPDYPLEKKKKKKKKTSASLRMDLSLSLSGTI